MNEKEKEVYEGLLEKMRGETDPDSCYAWAHALEMFCEAMVWVKEEKNG